MVTLFSIKGETLENLLFFINLNNILNFFLGDSAEFFNVLFTESKKLVFALLLAFNDSLAAVLRQTLERQTLERTNPRETNPREA